MEVATAADIKTYVEKENREDIASSMVKALNDNFIRLLYAISSSFKPLSIHVYNYSWRPPLTNV